MKTTGVFQTTEFVVKGKLPAQIVPFGDIHDHAPLHAADAFKKWCDDVSALANPYFIGLGDYHDLMSTTERAIVRHGLHDSTDETLNEFFKEKTRATATKLEFMSGRCIGLNEGNHFVWLRFGNELVTSTQYLCKLLACPYLGVCSLAKVTFKDNRDKRSLLIASHHGRGGGRTMSSSVNSVMSMALDVPSADIYLMGHDHKKFVIPDQSLDYCDVSDGVKDRERWFGRTGSFLKAYVKGHASYIVDIGGHPASLGGIMFNIEKCAKGLKIRGEYV